MKNRICWGVEEGRPPAKGPQDDRGTPHAIEILGQSRLDAGRYYEDAQDAAERELPAGLIHLRGTDQQHEDGRQRKGVDGVGKAAQAHGETKGPADRRRPQG